MVRFACARLTSLIFLCSAFGLLPAAHGAGKHVFTVDDLYRMGRVSGLAVAPDKPLVAFVVTSFSMEENTKKSSIWVASRSTVPTTAMVRR